MDNSLDELQLAQPRRHLVGLLVVSLVILGVGIWIVDGGTIVGWLFVLAGGIGGLAAPPMIWRPPVVVFDRERVTIETVFRSSRYDWDDVADIRIWEHRYLGVTTNRLVTLYLTGRSHRATTLSSSMGAGQATLPQLAVDADELLAIARRYWRPSASTS